MRNGEIIDIEIPSSAEYVGVVRRTVEGIAIRMQFAKTEIDDMKLAVGEACTNAVKYGISNTECSHVQIRCEVIKDGICVEIKNNICDKAILSVPDKPDVTKAGGFGLYIMNSLMDEVDLSQNLTSATVRMKKIRKAISF